MVEEKTQLSEEDVKSGVFMKQVIADVSQFKRVCGSEGHEKGFNKILEILKKNGFNADIQEFKCTDAPLNIMYRINGPIFAILMTLTLIAFYLISFPLLLIFSLLTLMYSLFSEKISSISFGKLKNVGRKFDCKNAYFKQSPNGEVKNKIVFLGHHDSKSQTYMVMIRAAIMIATTLIMLIFSIRMLINAIRLGLAQVYYYEPEIYWIIIYYVIALSIVFNRYDNKSPGANDNLSAVAVQIQLAIEFKNKPLKHTEVHFVFTDAEEMGLFGANEWVKSYKSELDRNTTFFIVMDTVGQEPIFNLKSYGIPPKKISKRFYQIIKKAQAEGKLAKLRNFYLPIGAATDHLPVKKHGYDSFVLTSLCRRVHTEKDSIEYIEESSLIKAKMICKTIIDVIENQ